jgi:hypothetical protein
MMTGGNLGTGWIQRKFMSYLQKNAGDANATANAGGACQRTRKEKVVERANKYLHRLWEMDEMSPLGDALKQL